MDIQLIIAGLMIVGAAVYAGNALLRKTKAFSKSSACGDDCGCSSETKPLN